MSHPIEPARNKTIAALISANPSLNPAELRVCLLVLEGLTTAEIARMLDLSIRTVQNHRYNIRKKLGVRSNLAVALMKIVLG
jgi:DNA-binding CsgD family transcriptional regulator